MPGDNGYLAELHTEQFREESCDRLIGSALLRRGSDGDSGAPIPLAQVTGLARPGDYFHGQQQSFVLDGNVQHVDILQRMVPATRRGRAKILVRATQVGRLCMHNTKSE